MKTPNKNVMITTLAVMISTIPLAQAGHNNNSRYSSNDGYATTPVSDFTVKAKVVSVTPIFKYRTINTPTESCYKEPVTYTNYDDGDRTGRMLLGGIIGGVIGNNIGHGKSRKVRAAVGALIGSQIGSNIANQHAYSTQHTGYEQRCETQLISETKKQLEGYNVSYRYNDRIMTTQMPYHPGRNIILKVNISPVFD